MNEPLDLMERVDGQHDVQSQTHEMRPAMMTPVHGQEKPDLRSTTDIYTRRTTTDRDAFMRRRIQWPY